MSFDAVRVHGLAEGHPPPATREDPVLPDSPRTQLGPTVATVTDRVLESLYAFDAVVRDARGRIALSFPRFDVERSEREPGAVVLEAAAALGRPHAVTGASGCLPDPVARA